MTGNELRSRLEALLGKKNLAERAAKALRISDPKTIYRYIREDRGQSKSCLGPIESAIELAEACPNKYLPDEWK